MQICVAYSVSDWFQIVAVSATSNSFSFICFIQYALFDDI